MVKNNKEINASMRKIRFFISRLIKGFSLAVASVVLLVGCDQFHAMFYNGNNLRKDETVPEHIDYAARMAVEESLHADLKEKKEAAEKEWKAGVRKKRANQVAHSTKAQDMQMSYSEFNYTDITRVVRELNHKPMLSFMNKAKLGSVIGGGIVCCIDFPYGVEKVHVKFRNSNYEDIDIEAPVLYDDPEHPGGYVVVHVLPGDKVVVVVTPIIPDPRADLLRERLKELGIKGIQLESWPTWQEGPRKYGTMPTFVKGKENALNEEP